MDPDQIGATGHRQGADRCRAPDTGARACFSQHFADEALARRPHQQRQSRRLEFVEPAQQFEVLVRGLGKTEAGIPDQLPPLHTGGQGPLAGLLQLLAHIRHQIVVMA